MPYAIGQTIWRNGDQVTIRTAPYTLYGGEWQDAIMQDGRALTVPTPEAMEEREAKRRAMEADARMRQRVLRSAIANHP